MDAMVVDTSVVLPSSPPSSSSVRPHYSHHAPASRVVCESSAMAKKADDDPYYQEFVTQRVMSPCEIPTKGQAFIDLQVIAPYPPHLPPPSSIAQDPNYTSYALRLYYLRIPWDAPDSPLADISKRKKWINCFRRLYLRDVPTERSRNFILPHSSYNNNNSTTLREPRQPVFDIIHPDAVNYFDELRKLLLALRFYATVEYEFIGIADNLIALMEKHCNKLHPQLIFVSPPLDQLTSATWSFDFQIPTFGWVYAGAHLRRKSASLYHF